MNTNSTTVMLMVLSLFAEYFYGVKNNRVLLEGEKIDYKWNYILLCDSV